MYKHKFSYFIYYVQLICHILYVVQTATPKYLILKVTVTTHVNYFYPHHPQIWTSLFSKPNAQEKKNYNKSTVNKKKCRPIARTRPCSDTGLKPQLD